MKEKWSRKWSQGCASDAGAATGFLEPFYRKDFNQSVAHREKARGGGRGEPTFSPFRGFLRTGEPLALCDSVSASRRLLPRGIVPATMIKVSFFRRARLPRGQLPNGRRARV